MNLIIAVVIAVIGYWLLLVLYAIAVNYKMILKEFKRLDTTFLVIVGSAASLWILGMLVK